MSPLRTLKRGRGISDPNRTIPTGSDLESRRFKSLIENSFDVFKIIDSTGGILYVSPSVERVSGYRPADYVGTKIAEWLHPDDVDRAMYLLDLIASDGQVDELIHVRDRHADGTYRTIEVAAQNRLEDPAIEGIVLNYRDITERREWEEALQRSEERYQKCFQSSPDSITISYINSGVLVEVNEGFERITGYSREEVIGRSSLDLNLWRDTSQREQLTRELEAKGAIHNFETEFVGKDGEVIVGRVSANVIDLHGAPCMLLTVRDVTRQKTQEVELRRMTEQLQREHKELTEKNIALKQVLEHLDSEKASYRHEIAANIENLLRPFIVRLRTHAAAVTSAEIDELERRLQTVLSEEIDQFQHNLSKLTPRELDICELIQEGKTSKEIAEKLGLSPETIHKHRQAIRRKLQIDHRGVNLSSYLRSR